jgi:toxin FitB
VIVLDTNVLSEIMLSSPNPVVYSWASQQPNDQLYTTAISMAEIFRGIELLPVGKRRTELLATAESVFTDLLLGRILAFDENAARSFALIAASRRVRGKPISLFDAQIAAIAKVRKAAVATRNVRDFEGCGVPVVNPWQP